MITNESFLVDENKNPAWTLTLTGQGYDSVADFS
jgi:hypothetical protein